MRLSSTSLINKTPILPASANIIFPANLLKATASYFSCSSFGIVLNPAIKKDPLPLDRMIPNTMNKIIIIMLDIFHLSLIMIRFLFSTAPSNCKQLIISRMLYKIINESRLGFAYSHAQQEKKCEYQHTTI